MKIQRPGNTESTLIYSHFLRSKYPELYNRNTEYNFIGWLYKACGFYDKSIDINNKPKIIESLNYNRWLKDYNKALCHCDHIEFLFGNPSFSDSPPNTFYDYISQFNSSSMSINCKILYNNTDTDWSGYWAFENQTENKYYGVFHRHYNILQDKKVLVISPFADLIKYQYNNAVYEIFENFPKFDLQCYAMPYTFLNDGPHNNFFETLDTICADIEQVDFDIALLSCGTYGTLLIEHISSIMKKDAIYFGRGCNPMFGIDPSRHSKKPHPLWITEIPQYLVYEHHEQIEDGVYWKSV